MSEHAGAGRRSTGELRRRAERLAASDADELDALSRTDIHDLVHELQVHEIELELQNEELQRASVELRAVSERYRSLYDFAPVGILSLDESQTVVEANLACCSMLETDRRDLTGKHLAKFLFDRTDGDSLYLHIVRARESKAVQTCELRFRRPNGLVLWASVTTLPLRIERSGEAFLLTLNDISARKSSEGELKAWSRTLEDRVRERTEELDATVAELQDEVSRRIRAEENLRARSDGLEALNRRLEERTLQLQRLTVQLGEAEDRERRRLAEVLHDDLQQILVGAGLQLGRLSKLEHYQRESATLEYVQSLLERAVEISRSLAHELSPPSILRESGLVPALQRLGQLMMDSHHLRVIVDASLDTEVANAAISSMLYRAVRELLNNASKHSGSDRAEVRLRCLGDQIEVLVEDFGRGLGPIQFKGGLPAREGFGLRSVRERVEVLGGTFEIDSRPGQGTRVRLLVPR